MHRPPLNPGLYAALKGYFRDVKIANSGMALQYKTLKDIKGAITDIIVVGGSEEYMVKCPFCRDHSHRLDVNHVFGTCVSGVPMYDRAHCWNCESPEVLPLIRDLADHVQVASIQGSKEVTEELSPDFMASISAAEHLKVVTKPLSSLPARHPAIEYIKARGFVPDMLEQIHDVRLVDDILKYGHNRRIYIPLIYENDNGLMIVGHQSRAVPGYSTSEKPKYNTSSGCKKSAFVYGMHTARHFPRGGIISEGPTKVWNIGLCSVGLWGRTISHMQAMWIARLWGKGDGPIAVFADPGWEAEAEKNAEVLRHIIPDYQRVITINPYDTRDCGDIPYDEVWGYIDYCTDRAQLPRLERGKKLLTWR